MKKELYVLFIFLLSSCSAKQSTIVSKRQQDSVILAKEYSDILDKGLENVPLTVEQLNGILPALKKNRFDLLTVKTYVFLNYFVQVSSVSGERAKFLNEVRTIAARNDDSVIQAVYYYLMGANTANQDAFKYYLKSMTLSKGRDEANYVNCLKMLQRITLEAADVTTAEAYTREFLERNKKSGAALQIALDYLNLADINYYGQNLNKAEQYYDSAKLIINKNQLTNVIHEQSTKGKISLLKGDYAQAVKDFNAELQKFEMNIVAAVYKAITFDQLGEIDSTKAALANLREEEEIIFGDAILARDYLPLKIKYTSGEEQRSLIDEYTALTKRIQRQGKGIVIEKYLHELAAAEAEKVHQQEIDKKDRITYLIIFSSIILGLTSLLIIFIIAAKRKKLKYQLLRSRFDASKQERDRISQELHDDLGARFTSIKLASELLALKSPDKKSRELEIILSNNDSIFIKIKEIIWSLNSQNDTLGNLILYIRRFAEDFLAIAHINLVFSDHTEDMHRTFLEAYTRRRIYLAVKEILNNAVKHARATEISLSFSITDNHILHVNIADNGKGFEVQEQDHDNGLQNVKNGISDLPGGKVALHSDKNGTTYDITIKV